MSSGFPLITSACLPIICSIPFALDFVKRAFDGVGKRDFQSDRKWKSKSKNRIWKAFENIQQRMWIGRIHLHYSCLKLKLSLFLYFCRFNTGDLIRKYYVLLSVEFSVDIENSPRFWLLFWAFYIINQKRKEGERKVCLCRVFSL